MDFVLSRLVVGAFNEVATVPGTITAVLSLCERQPDPVAQCLMLHAPIPDEVELSATTWEELTTCLTRLLAHGHTVFVHCRLGKSRSPALCAAHLIRCGYTPENALAIVQKAHAYTCVHPETWKSVLRWWASKKTSLEMAETIP